MNMFCPDVMRGDHGNIAVMLLLAVAQEGELCKRRLYNSKFIIFNFFHLIEFFLIKFSPSYHNGLQTHVAFYKKKPCLKPHCLIIFEVQTKHSSSTEMKIFPGNEGTSASVNP